MTTHIALDCACDTRPHFADMKAAGVTHVIRYFGSRKWKCASRAECDALRAAGFRIVSVYETTADMMAGGFTAGVDGAQKAMAGILVAGGPDHPFIYFANDTSIVKPSVACEYLDGAASVIGVQHVGLYGGFAWCEKALVEGHAERAWQTVAWSHGRRLTTAALYQRGGRVPGLKFDHDRNDVLTADGNVGEWPA